MLFIMLIPKTVWKAEHCILCKLNSAKVLLSLDFVKSEVGGQPGYFHSYKDARNILWTVY